ncbi:hypothetical protein JCM10213_004612 [Rhodosporidiobolus nylandii]
MLDRVPELALAVADWLDLPTLAHLSLVNRTLNKLSRARLYAHVDLSGGGQDPWSQDEQEQGEKIEAKADSLLEGDEARLKLVKRLTIVGNAWTTSKAGMGKVEKLTQKMWLAEIVFMHRKTPVEDDELERWQTLDAILASQHSSALALRGKPRPCSVGAAPHGIRFQMLGACPRTSLSIPSLASYLQPNLRLERLELVDLDYPLVKQIAKSFKAFVAISSDPPPLRSLKLDLFPESEAGTKSFSVFCDRFLRILATFSRASGLTSLQIGSTGLKHKGLPLMVGSASLVPLGFQLGPLLDAADALRVAGAVADGYPELESLVLRLDPRMDGWFRRMQADEVADFAQALSSLKHLRRFESNILLPSDDMAEPPSSPSAADLEAVARLFVLSIPSIEAISLVDYPEHQYDWFSEPAEGEKAMRMRWRSVRGEGAEFKLVEA